MKTLLNFLLSLSKRKIVYVNCYAATPNDVHMLAHFTKKQAMEASEHCPERILVFKAKRFVELP